MDYTENGAPIFNSQNGMEYEIWSKRTKVFLKARGYDVWQSIVIGYTTTNKSNTVAKKELKRNKKNSNGFHLRRIT
jgi:hypothetical protein